MLCIKHPLPHDIAFEYKYVSKNIMENGAFAPSGKCSIFHKIFTSIQNFT